MGLPGDTSSESRFVRSAFNLLHSYRPTDEIESVTQFFHLLGSVEVVSGAVRLEGGNDRTQYSSCYDTDSLTYYYKTYDDTRIHALRLYRGDMEGTRLIKIPLSFAGEFDHIN